MTIERLRVLLKPKNTGFALIFILLLFKAGKVEAQSWLPSFLRDTVDTKYIERYDNRLHLKTVIATKDLNFSLRNRNRKGPVLSYAPNDQYFIGLGAAYNILGGELLFKLSQSENAIKKFGSTKSFDIQFNYYGSRFSADLVYQRYKGFYLTEPGLALSNWTEDLPYPSRPDLNVKSTGLNLYYVFNHYKFSYQAAFQQTKRQRKSAGSFLFMTSFWSLNIESDSSLIPALIRSEFGDNTDINYGRFYTIALMPGYGFTKVHDRFYGTLAACAGPGLQYRNYLLEDVTHDDAGLIPKFNIRVAGGYNGEKIFTGVTVVFDRVFSNFENINLRSNTNNLKLFVGYRFSLGLTRKIKYQR